ESVGKGSLHRNPNALQRQVTLIWNRVAADPDLGPKLLRVPSFRGPPKRIAQSLLPASFRENQGRSLDWCAGSDPFATDARNKPLAPRTLKLAKDQIHAAVTALVKSGKKPEEIRSLAALIAIENFRSILRQRIREAGRPNKSFDHYL